MRSQRLLGVLALAALLCLAALVAVLVGTQALSHLDLAWSQRAQAAGRVGVPWGGGEQRWAVATKIAEIGDGPTVVGASVLAASATALATRRWRPVLASATTLGLLIAAVEGGKTLLGRQSPDVGSGHPHVFGVGGAAFPSGHSSGTLVVFGLVAALFCGPGGIRPSRVGHAVLTLVAVSVSAVVGFCTVMVGWHWPTDVAGGWLLGIAVLILGNALLRRGAPAATSRTRAKPAAAPAAERVSAG